MKKDPSTGHLHRVTGVKQLSPVVMEVANHMDIHQVRLVVNMSSQSSLTSKRLLKPEYDSESRREAEKEEKEEEKKPSRLELLLAESKFSCGSKKDGYYADLSVGCQVFHYCVAGVKHSWQCPERKSPSAFLH